MRLRMEIGFGSVVNLLSYLPFSSRRLCFSSLSDIILHLGRSPRLPVASSACAPFMRRPPFRPPTPPSAMWKLHQHIDNGIYLNSHPQKRRTFFDIRRDNMESCRSRLLPRPPALYPHGLPRVTCVFIPVVRRCLSISFSLVTFYCMNGFWWQTHPARWRLQPHSTQRHPAARRIHCSIIPSRTGWQTQVETHQTAKWCPANPSIAADMEGRYTLLYNKHHLKYHLIKQ